MADTLANVFRNSFRRGFRGEQKEMRDGLGRRVWIPPNGRDATDWPIERPDAKDTRLKPNPGPQESFLRCDADVAIFGGAAGGGKTLGLLLEAARHVDNPHFSAIIFRRTYPEVAAPGGLWEQALRNYPALGATPRPSEMSFIFPSSAKVKFAHLQHEKNVHQYQGSELAMIGLDEATHFSEFSFWYLLSRNRSTCGVRPYFRMTCNPDADSWLAEFISWWLDEHTGLPIPERAGVVRWFARINETLTWGNTWGELHEQFPDKIAPEGIEPDGVLEFRTKPKTAAFVPSKLSDNPILMRSDPGYMANLQAMPLVERERLLEGNWKIRPEAGKVFNREWFGIAPAVPAGGEECRFWDFAATVQELKGDDPDWTAGVRMRLVGGVCYITDIVRVRRDPADVLKMVENLGCQDTEAAKRAGTRHIVAWEEEGGSAGKYNTRNLGRTFAPLGVECKSKRSVGDKVQRAYPLSGQAEMGNVKLVPSMFSDKSIMEAFLREAHNMPDDNHDDMIDAASGAYGILGTARRATVY